MMTLANKKNPAIVLVKALAYWWSLRRTGAFAWTDAWMNWREWLLPNRFCHRTAGEALAREAFIERVEPGVHQVTLPEHDLVFFWLGKVDNSLHYPIAQEFDPCCPHFYTTAPVRMTPQSVVVDVGACEGLFAFRLLRQGQAAKVVCFEPSARTAEFLRRAAKMNGVGDRVVTEVMAVSKNTGEVYFEEGDCPDGNRIVGNAGSPKGRLIPAISLDDYCTQHNINLSDRDLIKIDAEGADLDVLRGAEKLIRAVAPQIAVTTYHEEEHAREILAFLTSIQPQYRFRIKGFTLFGSGRFLGGAKPRPVLLQASRGTGA